MKPVMVPTTDVNSETAIVTAWHVPDRSQVRAGELVARGRDEQGGAGRRGPRLGLPAARRRGGRGGLAGSSRSRTCSRPRGARGTRRPPGGGGHAGRGGDIRRRACDDTRDAARRELGVDLASLATGELVTVKMVEAAAGDGATAAPSDLPLPLEAPSGVERVAVIGAGLGATQVIDIFAPGSSTNAAQAPTASRRDRRRRPEPVGEPGGGGPRRGRHAATGGALRRGLLRHRRDRSIGTSVSGSDAVSRAVRRPRHPAHQRHRSDRPDLHRRRSSGPGTSSAPIATSASARASGTTTCCPPTTPSIITTFSGPTSRRGRAA